MAGPCQQQEDQLNKPRIAALMTSYGTGNAKDNDFNYTGVQVVQQCETANDQGIAVQGENELSSQAH